MKRKQVNAFLKVMSKDNFRPIISTAYIDRYNDKTVMVATDGYVLSAVYIDDNANHFIGTMIRRDAIERWYKLANAKSILDGNELIKIAGDDDTMHGEPLKGRYPDWQKLIPKDMDKQAFDKDISIAFNANIVKTIQELEGTDSIKLNIYGKLAPMVVDTENGIHLIMPVKQ